MMQLEWIELHLALAIVIGLMTEWDWKAEGYKEIPEGHTLHPDHVKAMEEGRKRFEESERANILRNPVVAYWDYILNGNRSNDG